MPAHIANIIDLFEKFPDIEFLVEPDSDAEFEHSADRSGQRATGNQSGAISREFGAVDPIAEDHTIEQPPDNRNVRSQRFEQSSQPGVPGLDMPDLATDEKLQVVGFHLIDKRGGQDDNRLLPETQSVDIHLRGSFDINRHRWTGKIIGGIEREFIKLRELAWADAH